MNPRFLDVPISLTAERLLIRQWQPGDSEQVYPAIVESRPELAVWMPWARTEQSAQAIEAVHRAAQAEASLRQEIGMGIYLRTDGSFIGAASLYHFEWDIPSCALGYWLRTSAYGHGYMTETVNALTEYGRRFLNLVRIEIWCDSLNEKSWKVAERAGYKREATMRHHRRGVNGELHDSFCYAFTWPDDR